jgi:non-lysosomal glucosylceramidase
MAETRWNPAWPVLKSYESGFLSKIALPLGGIGTGTVSLGGRGQWRDWEIRNRPAKGFQPTWRSGSTQIAPFFALRAAAEGAAPFARVLEGSIPPDAYEGGSGCPVPLHGLPRFRHAAFAVAYPLGQVALDEPGLPLTVRLEAFNPLIPCEPDRSGFPCAAARYVVRNTGAVPLDVSVCGTLVAPWEKGDGEPRQERQSAAGLQGVLFECEGGDSSAPGFGTLALAALAEPDEQSMRTRWPSMGWGDVWLDFWSDFLSDGRLEEPGGTRAPCPVGSLTVSRSVPAGGEMAFTFLIAWHYPNRMDWQGGERVGNYYTTRDADAWAAAARMARELPALEADTLRFVRAFCDSPLPPVVKEAALFNLSTLRSQTCFRTEDGHFFGWEGCSDSAGCCSGSCTHVWNYETALPFLFGSLSRSMREVSFLHGADERGLMHFRTQLPLAAKATAFGKAAADGQTGAVMRLYLDWRLGGGDEWLRKLWPAAKRALEFCWIPGGWDADRDGVMEGCQHNTMDVEYYGPNPQMGLWYLGALLAGAEMAERMGEPAFGATCRRLYERGRPYLMRYLFNGEYFEQLIRPPADPAAIAPGLSVGMGGADLADPSYQLGSGCLVDQLVGQVFAHLCGLNYLVPPENCTRTLKAILTYNFKRGFHDHFNPLRSFVMGDESALLMASYPRGNRPRIPFPYADEVMTGFEYTAAVGMLLEGMTDEGLMCIGAIRDRYDGLKRNPFDEAECGHHYARAMMSWSAVPALTGFRYYAAEGLMKWGSARGVHFWSNGFAWGTLDIRDTAEGAAVKLDVLGGKLLLNALEIAKAGTLAVGRTLAAGDCVEGSIGKKRRATPA